MHILPFFSVAKVSYRAVSDTSLFLFRRTGRLDPCLLIALLWVKWLLVSFNKIANGFNPGVVSKLDEVKIVRVKVFLRTDVSKTWQKSSAEWSDLRVVSGNRISALLVDLIGQAKRDHGSGQPSQLCYCWLGRTHRAAIETHLVQSFEQATSWLCFQWKDPIQRRKMVWL